MISVLIVDDQPLIRQAVTAIIEPQGDITVVGQASDGAEAVALAQQLCPDVVLMDIRMPGVDGIAATERICESPALQATRVLILTTFEEEDYVVAALRAGASGFLGKGSEPDEIVRAISAVHAGDSLLSPAATRSLIRRSVFSQGDQAAVALIPSPQLETLTERESEVLLMVARGLTNQQIADALFISPHTAKTHVNRIMAKVHAHDRAQLVILAYESGLLKPGE